MPDNDGDLPSPAELQKALEAVIQSNDALLAQNKALQQLLMRTTSRTNGNEMPKVAPQMSTSVSSNHEIERANSGIWADIFSMSATSSPEFMKAFYHWDSPESVQQVLNGSVTWTSWTYAAAFPHLSSFLKRVSPNHRCHCQVDLDDLLSIDQGRRSTSYSETRNKIDKFWDLIKVRPAFPQVEGQDLHHRVSARLFKIIDLSPLVLTALLASTPQSDLSYMAAFVERYLKLSNWGKVSLLKFGDMDWSSYTFEYHFSFYYITPEYSDHDKIKTDPRECRRSAPFGKEMATETRAIHEETLAFLLVGHFKDVTTCVQLAESFFRFDPYAKKALNHPFRCYDLHQSPGLMLLSWIGVSLHHVLWRWQSAIEAVENEIMSSSQIVFMRDRSDLMADDPQFSLSKTYFWALQAYKLFEETLLETIATWNKFKLESLPRLEDPRMCAEDRQTSIDDIDDAIKELEAKVARIKKRYKEVKDLRTGLESASALFDSRTTVRQGENVRLLTYITILFVPLSLGTSIFGMQFIGSSRHFVTAFAIALPSITVFFALLVFNLETILCAFGAMSEKTAHWLRNNMRRHRRRGWKARAVALQEDEAMTKAPMRRATRQSSGWVYIFFVLEYLLVTLPVAEIVHFLDHFHFRPNGNLPARPNHQRSSTLTVIERGDDTVQSEAERRKRRTEIIKEKVIQSVEVEKRKEQEQRELERGPLVVSYLRLRRGARAKVQPILQGTLTFFRTIVMLLGVILLLIEYACATVYLLLRSGKSTTEKNGFAGFTNSVQQVNRPAWREAYKLLGLDTIYPLGKQNPPELDQHERQAISRAATLFMPPSNGTFRVGVHDTVSVSGPYDNEEECTRLPPASGVRRVETESSDGGSLQKGSSASDA